MTDFDERINDIEKRLVALEEITNRITCDDMKAGRSPHKCPVCGGSGFLIKIIECIDCHACEGKGIVWA